MILGPGFIPPIQLLLYLLNSIFFIISSGKIIPEKKGFQDFHFISFNYIFGAEQIYLVNLQFPCKGSHSLLSEIMPLHY